MCLERGIELAAFRSPSNLRLLAEQMLVAGAVQPSIRWVSMVSVHLLIHESPMTRTFGTLLLIALALTFKPLAASDTLIGRVFEDLNHNGVPDTGEPGVAGVRVSNGEDVVLTNASGRYQLDIKGDSIVFITKPAGYMTPQNKYRLPQFYYLHRPNGSPQGLRYQGIDPTGPLPESIDFPLLRHQESGTFEAILFADTQPQTEEELDYIRDSVVTELIGTDAAFGMTMGDILFDDLSMLPRLSSIIAQIGVPWYNVPGNHELNFLATEDAYSLETFSRWYGPPYYAFEYGDAVFVVLDDVHYRGAKASGMRGNGGYFGKFGDRQLDWLKAELAHVPKDKLLVLAMHIPLLTRAGDEGDRRGVEDRQALFDLISDYPHLYSVAGHTHTTQHVWFGEEDGFSGEEAFHHHVLTTVSGSWWSGPFDADSLPISMQRDGTPRGYHRLQVDGADMRVKSKAAGHPDDYQMRIMLDAAHHGPGGAYRDFRPGELYDGRITEDQVAAAAVAVNLFDGGPRSKVKFQVGDRDPVEMQRQIVWDPSYLEYAERNGDSIKSWVEPEPSTHIWVGDLPDDLAPGTHVLSVVAVDEFGSTHHGHKVIEITGTSQLR